MVSNHFPIRTRTSVRCTRAPLATCETWDATRPCRIPHYLVSPSRFGYDAPHFVVAIVSAEARDASTRKWPSAVPCGDALDKKIASLALPDIAAFLIPSTVQASDLFWVGRLGEALAVASLSAVNQLYSTFNLLTSTIRTITAPRVAAARATNDTAGVQEAVGEALFISGVLGLLCTVLVWKFQKPALLSIGNPNALPWSVPYSLGRLPGVVPAASSLVGIAAFRGMLDTITPLRIALASNVINLLLDPFLIFTASLGIAGCGLAASVSHIFAAVTYLTLLLRRAIVRWGTIFKMPSITALKRLGTSVGAMQMRSMASQFATLLVTKTVQRLDQTGIAAAAHAVTIQRWVIGCIILGGMNTAASIIIPSELSSEAAGVQNARAAASRLLSWGFIVGVVLAAAQLATLPLLDVLTPLPEVRRAAVLPSIIAAMLQIVNGVTSVGEGIMVGTQSFGTLAFFQVVASTARLIMLHLAPATLPVVWCSLGVSQAVLLASVLLHHFITGPLAQDWSDQPPLERASRSPPSSEVGKNGSAALDEVGARASANVSKPDELGEASSDVMGIAAKRRQRLDYLNPARNASEFNEVGQGTLGVSNIVSAGVIGLFAGSGLTFILLRMHHRN